MALVSSITSDNLDVPLYTGFRFDVEISANNLAPDACNCPIGNTQGFPTGIDIRVQSWADGDVAIVGGLPFGSHVIDCNSATNLNLTLAAELTNPSPSAPIIIEVWCNGTTQYLFDVFVTNEDAAIKAATSVDTLVSDIILPNNAKEQISYIYINNAGLDGKDHNLQYDFSGTLNSFDNGSGAINVECMPDDFSISRVPLGVNTEFYKCNWDPTLVEGTYFIEQDFYIGEESHPNKSLLGTMRHELIVSSAVIVLSKEIRRPNFPYTAYTDIDANPQDVFNGSIADIRETKYTYRSINPINDGYEVYYHGWLYSDTCNWGSEVYPSGNIDNPPPVAYYHKKTGSTPLDTEINMPLTGLSGANVNSQKNLSVTIEYPSADPDQFIIRHRYYNIADIDSTIEDFPLNNHDKLLKNHVDNVNELDNSFQSVYNIDRQFCTLTYIKDPNNIDPSTGMIIEGYDDSSFSTSIRFYDRGLYDGAAEMTNPNFEFIRGIDFVNDLSSTADTAVSFTINSSDPVENAAAYLINVTANNNSTTFEANYDSNLVRVLDTAVGVPLNNAIKGEAKEPFNTTGTEYKTEFTISKDHLDPNSTYRLIVIQYTGDVSTLGISNSFISDELSISTLPDGCCSFNNTHTITDYTSGDVSNREFIVVPQDRVKSSGSIDFASGKSCIDDFYAGWGLTPPVNPIEKLKEIRFRVLEILDDTPTAGTATIATLEDSLATRTGLDTYLFNLGTSNVEFNVTDNGSILNYDYTFRVRYESGVLPIDVGTANMLNIPNITPLATQQIKDATAQSLGLNQDWSNKTLIVLWDAVLEFNDAPQPFKMVLNNAQRLVVGDYDNNSGTPELLNIRCLDPNTLQELTTIRRSDYQEILIEVERSTTTSNRLLIAQLDRVFFGVNNISEEDPVSGNLTQLSEAEIFDLDPSFLAGNDKAYFKLDIDDLPNPIYRVSAIIKP